MATDETINRLLALARVKHVGTGLSVGGHQPATLAVIALKPAPLKTIENITRDTEPLVVIELTEVPLEAGNRFRPSGESFDDLVARGGNGREGEGKMIAGRVGLEAEPTLNAIFKGELGLLFASVDDAARFDTAKDR
jgi:hypothetical protein